MNEYKSIYNIKIMAKTCNVEGCSSPVWGKGFCKNHQYKREDFNRNGIANYSSNMLKKLREYYKQAKEYIKQNPKCTINSPVCTGNAQHPHHKRGRGKYLLDQSTWEPACNKCNSYVEANHSWAVDNGHKESRLIIHNTVV